MTTQSDQPPGISDASPGVNAAKPDRQDGDRLPAINSRVRQSGVYGGTRDGTVIKSTANTFTVKWDMRTVACTYNRHEMRGEDIQCPINVLATSQPTRDAAEGAATNSTSAAVRESIGLHPALASICGHGPFSAEVGTCHVRAATIARDALPAAPVPSPDGAGKCSCGPMCQDLGVACRYFRPERALLRRLVDEVWQHATESKSVPSTDVADKLIDDSFINPSATGAVEPVAWRTKNNFGQWLFSEEPLWDTSEPLYVTPSQFNPV